MFHLCSLPTPPPLRYLCKDLILFCEISIDVFPLDSRCHTSITFSWKPSFNNHASSNLKPFAFGCDGVPVSSNSGVWSEMPLGSALTVTCGNLTSQFVLTRILSSFSKVGICKLLTQVNCRTDSSSSLKFKLIITALNREGHLSLYLLLFFHLGLE
jgi:hypothetical protein